MGELAAAIAHEVNQPLTAIVTNGQFCLRRLDGAASNPDELRAAITEIVNDGTRASAVISRIRGLLTKGTPNRTEIDINQIIQNATMLLRNEFTRNRLFLRTELAADLPRVPGDLVLLQQVLINLIMNAIDAMRTSTDGRREILIRSARNPDGVLVQVQDSGPGIEPEAGKPHLRAILHHESERHRNGALDQPFHNRVAWRPPMDHAQFYRGAVRIHSPHR